ncbi:MAG: aspartyl protease family protein [Deltaproteobacteria bacterium]|nr:aspartyl protease family protein [Deltaproteobacteria bacterium]MBW1950618.1 aspartyl protease family protein [Deltaproteobacteria bacterium]MBW2008865.1 aspartyl protease family protein [Deltaproteobacteria bacterium]MBW2349230.1 aspartyl protease family protein [Deltaproteobacteria bacterium]
MICPKCGFSQLDDVYCANCGINIEKFLQKNKKKRYAESILILMVCAGILVAAYRLHQNRSDRSKNLKTPAAALMPEAPREKARPQKHPTGRKGPRPRPRTAKAPAPSASPAPVQARQLSPSAGPPGRKATPEERASADAPNPSPGDRDRGDEESEPTAGQWFKKGLALDDDSDAEIQCYRKALDKNPEMAPALYRLGAIYFRRAEYDLADRAFAAFLRHATEEERRRYDIYVYYSLAEVEDLSQQKVQGDEERPGGGNASVGESGTQSEEGRGPPEEEAKAVVRFTNLRGQVVVPVLLNGRISTSMLLDTGAGITVISPALARALGLRAEGSRTVALKTLARDIRAPVVILEALKVGGILKQDHPVAVSELSMMDDTLGGILGMDFLGDMQIHIDTTHREVRLLPR